MGTAILRTEDCLKNSFHHKYFASRSPLPAPPPTMMQSRRKQSRKKLVMGDVKILRRGEPMMIKNGEPMRIKNSDPNPTPAIDFRSDGLDLALCSSERIGPDPKIMPKFADLDPVYAGPSVVMSPSPNSLPFPAFFLKKAADEADLATKGLRCLLRLDISG